MNDTPQRRAVTLDDIRKAKPKVKGIEVEEWGGTVYLRGLSANVGLELQEQMGLLPKGKQSEGMFMLLGLCLAKEDGSALFETQKQAREMLGEQDTQILLKLQDEALLHLGWTKLAEAEIKNASGGAAAAASPAA